MGLELWMRFQGLGLFCYPLMFPHPTTTLYSQMGTGGGPDILKSPRI